jgi:hypothetical protein
MIVKGVKIMAYTSVLFGQLESKCENLVQRELKMTNINRKRVEYE